MTVDFTDVSLLRIFKKYFDEKTLFWDGGVKPDNDILDLYHRASRLLDEQLAAERVDPGVAETIISDFLLLLTNAAAVDPKDGNNELTLRYTEGNAEKASEYLDRRFGLTDRYRKITDPDSLMESPKKKHFVLNLLTVLSGAAAFVSVIFGVLAKNRTEINAGNLSNPKVTGHLWWKKTVYAEMLDVRTPQTVMVVALSVFFVLLIARLIIKAKEKTHHKEKSASIQEQQELERIKQALKAVESVW